MCKRLHNVYSQIKQTRLKPLSQLEDLDFCKSRIYKKKGRKTKEFPRIEGTIFEMW
jgi:hypothetical protein